LQLVSHKALAVTIYHYHSTLHSQQGQNAIAIAIAIAKDISSLYCTNSKKFKKIKIWHRGTNQLSESQGRIILFQLCRVA
jgi:hypothetical protein